MDFDPTARPPPGTIPEVPLFFEQFDCIMRGFVRRARPLERDRFGAMVHLYGRVREWAGSRGDRTLLSRIELHMQLARAILDVPQGREEESGVVDDPVAQNWILGNASLEEGDFARAAYDRCLDRLEEFGDAELAARMRLAHEEENPK